MSIDNYELLELWAQDDELETFKGLEITSSKSVIVHAIRISSDLDDPTNLSRRIQSVISKGPCDDILFAGERNGKLCVVTEPNPGCYDLRGWLEDRMGSTAQPLLSIPTTDTGDFTSLLRSPLVKPADPEELTVFQLNMPLRPQPKAAPVPVIQSLPETPKPIVPLAPAKPSYLPLILILGVLFIVAVALMLFFVLKA